MFRKIQKLLRSTRGVATSLLEATATIAVGATLAGAAVGVVTDKVQEARIAQALADVQAIGDAINAFEQDNGFYPIFDSAGNSASTDANPFTSPLSGSRSNVDILESADGAEPQIAASANNGSNTFNTTTHPGHQRKSGDVDGDEADDGWNSPNSDTLENQLKNNKPGYRLRGEILFDPGRGFNGPYLAALPPTDPWGNRYKSNVIYLDDHRVSDGTGVPFQTLVLSAGPNELIQTKFEVTAASEKTAATAASGQIAGDDIAFRVR